MELDATAVGELAAAEDEGNEVVVQSPAPASQNLVSERQAEPLQIRQYFAADLLMKQLVVQLEPTQPNLVTT
jgi:hypothetical protein